MSITKTQTKFFTSGPIKFSEIRDNFGDLAGDPVRASDYKRNAAVDVDWDSTTSPRVPDATENANVSSGDDWEISGFRDTIVEYNVVQDASTSDEELEYAIDNTSDWNNNLGKNVNKNFDIKGTVFSNEPSKYALKFTSGDYTNLYIDVNDGGEILGEGGAVGGGNGGGALYIDNTLSADEVSIVVGTNGKIWAGGGGGTSGNSGNAGNSLSCYTSANWGTSVNRGDNRNYSANASLAACKNAAANNITLGNVNVTSATPSDVRSRCRGGSYRRGQGWNSTNFVGYFCSPSANLTCYGRINNNVSGGNGGNAGNGGVGQGYSNQSNPGSGNNGNSGNCNTCNQTGARSCGNAGNDGNSGGAWGQAASTGGAGGSAVHKKNAVVNQYSSNTLKGGINNI